MQVKNNWIQLFIVNVTTAFLQLHIVANKISLKDYNTNWTQPVVTSKIFSLSQRAYNKRLHEKLLIIRDNEKN